MTNSNCPTPLEFQRMLRGEVSDRRLDELSSHLVQCVKCLELIEKIPIGNNIREAIEKQSLLIQNDSVVLDAIDRARAIYQENSQSSNQDTARDCLDETVSTNDTPRCFSFLAPPVLPDEIGRLGKYRVLKELGQGGMGVVFLANDPALNRNVALKVVWMARPLSPNVKRRFLQEARALASIDHPNVVPVYSVEEFDSVPYITMKLLKGRSLADRLDGGQPLDESSVIRLGRDLARALVAVHNTGIVHRDLKPANIWLTESGDGLLIDFGLARTEDLELTATGSVLGTPRYMSPEQANGEPATEQSDLFSMGCVLYHALSGKPPFDEVNLPKLMRSISDGRFHPLDRVAVNVSPELSQIVHKLLDVNPASRYESAEVLDNDLSRLGTVVWENPNRRISPSSHSPRRNLEIAVALATLIAVAVASALYVSNHRAVNNRRRHYTAPANLDAFELTNCEREIIPWVFSTGGSLVIHKDNEDGSHTAINVASSSEMPPSPWRLHGIVLNRVSDLPSELLRPDELPHLLVVSIQDSQLGDKAMSAIGEITPLRMLHLADCSVTDDGFKHLSSLGNLELMKFGNTKVDAEGLVHLPVSLIHLTITQQEITIEDVKTFREFPHLTMLSLFSVPLNDAMMSIIGDLSSLEELVLQDVQLSPSGLKQLNRLANLKRLDIIRNSMPSDSVGALQAVLPNCKITWIDGEE